MLLYSTRDVSTNITSVLYVQYFILPFNIKYQHWFISPHLISSNGSIMNNNLYHIFITMCIIYDIPGGRYAARDLLPSTWLPALLPTPASTGTEFGQYLAAWKSPVG